MIICSCNLISDKDVFAAISEGASRPSQIYAHKKCKADCGGCTKQICRLLKERKNELHPADHCAEQKICPNRTQLGCATKTLKNNPLMHEAALVFPAQTL